MMETADSEVKVSVISIAYNHEKYIRNTLEGFVNQKTNFKFEVLVHDDASTDKTADIIKEYEKKYPDIIKPIYQTENQYSKHVKISPTFLYPKAQGKYFAYCEGDDYWCDDYKLQKQYDALENNHECSICVCKAQCINEDGSINERIIPDSKYITHNGILSQAEVAEAIWKVDSGGYPFHTSTYFLRRSAIKDIMQDTFPCTGYLNGDQAMLRSALNDGKFYYIEDVMSCRRLMSIGSYNMRFLSLSNAERQEHSKKFIKGDLLFDEYSKGKFHKWIMCSVANRLCVLGQSDARLMKETAENVGITEKDIMKNCSAKNKILYRIARISPALFELLVDWRYKIFPN